MRLNTQRVVLKEVLLCGVGPRSSINSLLVLIFSQVLDVGSESDAEQMLGCNGLVLPRYKAQCHVVEMPESISVSCSQARMEQKKGMSSVQKPCIGSHQKSSLTA